MMAMEALIIFFYLVSNFFSLCRVIISTTDTGMDIDVDIDTCDMRVSTAGLLPDQPTS